MVCHVSDQSSEMLELLEHKNISIGTRLEVKKKFDFDNSHGNKDPPDNQPIYYQ